MKPDDVRDRNHGFYSDHAKRAFDFIFATALITLGFIPGLLLVLAIRLDSRGGGLYRQERVGRDGRPFSMYKFRSMAVGAESMGKGMLVEKNDGRITRMGRFLRKTSLDELPQILNIWRGDMSVIGPRPGLQYQADQYTPEQWRRLLVRPGVTGWAQVNGRNAIPWDERIRLDCEYVDRISLSMDVRVLWRTVTVVLQGSDQIAAKDWFREKARREAKASTGHEEGTPEGPRDGVRSNALPDDRA